jgi:hypothetical protein
MALLTHVTDRIGANRLKPLTNPGVPAAASINATILQKACDDVTADFDTIGQLAYDDTDAQHISVAVRGVVEKLRIWVGQLSVNADGAEPWHLMLRALRDTGPRARVLPGSNSVVTPTERGDGTHRPDFDWPKFEDVTPDAPSTRSADPADW